MYCFFPGRKNSKSDIVKDKGVDPISDIPKKLPRYVKIVVTTTYKTGFLYPSFLEMTRFCLLLHASN